MPFKQTPERTVSLHQSVIKTYRDKLNRDYLTDKRTVRIRFSHGVILVRPLTTLGGVMGAVSDAFRVRGRAYEGCALIMLRTLREDVVKLLLTWIATLALLPGAVAQADVIYYDFEASTFPSIETKFFIEACSIDIPNCRASSDADAEDLAVDKLVFGSFKNAEKAGNWAMKLSHLLNIDIGVESVHIDSGVLHRVITVAASPKTLNTASRVADSHGLTYWRIVSKQTRLRK